MKMQPLANLISSRLALTLSLIVGAAFGVISCVGQATLAQSINPSTSGNNPTDETQATEGDTSLSGPAKGSLNPLEMIHQSNLSRSRGMGEFQKDTVQNLNNAAADFKRQQQELLQHQQSNSPSNSTVENPQ